MKNDPTKKTPSSQTSKYADAAGSRADFDRDERRGSQESLGARHERQSPESPQHRTKDPHDQDPKWPGGGKKGEDEK